MFGTLVVAAVEASIISLKVSSAILMQMQSNLRFHEGNRSEADLLEGKFVALRQAFAEALSDPTQAKITRDLRHIIRSNYERLLAGELRADSTKRTCRVD